MVDCEKLRYVTRTLTIVASGLLLGISIYDFISLSINVRVIA